MIKVGGTTPKAMGLCSSLLASDKMRESDGGAHRDLGGGETTNVSPPSAGAAAGTGRVLGIVSSSDGPLCAIAPDLRRSRNTLYLIVRRDRTGATACPGVIPDFVG